MMNMGEKLSEEECDFLVDVSIRIRVAWVHSRAPDELNYINWKEADTDGDGSINFEEFVSMMKSAGHYSKVDGSWQLSETKSTKWLTGKTTLEVALFSKYFLINKFSFDSWRL